MDGRIIPARTVAEKNLAPNPDNLVPAVSTPLLAERPPSSAFHIPNKPWSAADMHPSSNPRHHSNPVRLPSSEQPSRASLRPVPFHHIRRHIPWPEPPSSELAAYTVEPWAWALVVADKPSLAGTELRMGPRPAEKSPEPERDETTPAAEMPEHKEHRVALLLDTLADNRQNQDCCKLVVDSSPDIRHTQTANGTDRKLECSSQHRQTTGQCSTEQPSGAGF